MSPRLFKPRQDITLEAWHIPNMPVDAPGMYEQIHEIIEWCGGRYCTRGANPAVIVLHTDEGEVFARLGDWIVKGSTGMFFVRDNKTFTALYEPVMRS